MTEVGRNVKYTQDGKTLTITIDLAADKEESKSGKSMLVATTAGNKLLKLEGYKYYLGLNLYEKKE